MATPAADATPVRAVRRRHVAAVSLGNALEFYDFLTYSFFAIQIGRALFPPTGAYTNLMLSLATFGAGFATRPIGAAVIGAYADRVGRRPAMMACFVMMGVAIVGLALIPRYETIGIAAPILAVLARMLQGFSLGGEIGSSTAYLVEAATPHRRGLVVSWQSATQQVALLAGSIVGATLTAFLSADQLDSYGWRIAFLVGGVSVPVGLWLRTSLPETLHSDVSTDASSARVGSRMKTFREHWRVLVLGLVVLGGATIASYGTVYIVTYAQDTLHMPARAGFLAEAANNVVAIPAVLCGGWLSDRIGRRPVTRLSNLAALVVLYPMFWLTVTTRSEVALIAGLAIYGAVSNLQYGAFTAALGESLPTHIRSSGFGTVYSVAIAAFGGTTQLVITWLIHTTGNPLAPAWYMIGAAAAAQVGLTLFRETAPRRIARS